MTMNGTVGLAAVDAGDPEAPRLVAGADTSGGAMAGDKALVADGFGGVQVFEIAADRFAPRPR